jgi:hypothetical protein
MQEPAVSPALAPVELVPVVAADVNALKDALEAYQQPAIVNASKFDQGYYAQLSFAALSQHGRFNAEAEEQEWRDALIAAGEDPDMARFVRRLPTRIPSSGLSGASAPVRTSNALTETTPAFLQGAFLVVFRFLKLAIVWFLLWMAVSVAITLIRNAWSSVVQVLPRWFRSSTKRPLGETK